MREMTFVEVSREEFDAFSAAHPQGNFQQSTTMGDVRAADGAEVCYLGVREAGALVAATQMVTYRSRLSTFSAIYDGPLCDFHDAELTAFLFEGLRSRARKAGAAQLEVMPEAPYQIRDTWGRALPAQGSDDPWPEGVPAEAPVEADQLAFDNLVACGLVHGGFDHQYNAVPRWRYVKDLSGIRDEQALLDSYTKNTRRDIRIAGDSFVSIEPADRAHLADFHALCELSAEKQGFDNRPLSYYERLYDAFGDRMTFNVAYIDMPAYLATWEAKRDALQADIDRFEAMLAGDDDGQAQFRSHRKAKRQLADAREKHASAERRVEVARARLAEQGAHIPAAAALAVWGPRECVYLFSGADPRLAAFCAPNYLQHHVMRTCLERGVGRYNFYGINGVFDDPDDPGRGLLEFKQGFGGYVEELMGSFTLPVRPMTYALKQLGHKVLGR